MRYNSFYHILRRKGRTDDRCVYWTGEEWSNDPDDAVLFRHAGTAAKYAGSCGMRVLVPGDWVGGETAVYVMEVTPELGTNAIHF